MHPAFSHMHTQIQYPCWAGEGGDVEESQGWLIDLGMVLIVSMMEGTTPVRVCTRACVRACTRLPSFIDHVPGASVNAQGFQVLGADSGQSHSMKKCHWRGICVFNP